MPRNVRRECPYGGTVHRTLVLLVDLFGVLPEKRSPRLLVQELMAGLAQ